MMIIRIKKGYYRKTNTSVCHTLKSYVYASPAVARGCWDREMDAPNREKGYLFDVVIVLHNFEP